MSAEFCKATAGLDVTIIPTKGTAGVMNDLLGSHVPVAFGVIPPALGNLQGQARAIAVASPAALRCCPTRRRFAGSGMPGFEAVLHYKGAPAAPRAIVERLNSPAAQARRQRAR